MKKYALFLALPGILAVLAGPVAAGESGRPGRAGVPVFGRAGGLFLIAQDERGGLSYAAAGPADAAATAPSFVSGAAPLGIAAKAAPSGEIGVAWIRAGRNAICELVFGRIRDGRLLQCQTVRTTTSALFSPDVDYDDASNPWLSWVQGCQGGQEIVVLDLARGRTWVVNGPEDGSALAPKIVVASAQKAWAVWTGREAGCDQIMAASFLSGSWSRPVPVNRDARFPHMAPAASLDASGRPWIVWSAYDGEDYEIYGSFWTDDGWAGEERISDSADSDTSPGIAIVRGAIPVVVWARAGLSSGPTLCASARRDGRWSGVTTIVAGEAGPVRSVSVTARGDTVGFSWGAGGRLRSGTLALGEITTALPEAAIPGPPPQTVSPPDRSVPAPLTNMLSPRSGKTASEAPARTSARIIQSKEMF